MSEIHKVYSVPRWLLIGNKGTAWLPNVSLVASDLSPSEYEETKNHEKIHQLQQNELGYFKWAYVYLKLLCIHGYDNHPMEIDAYTWERDIWSRPYKAWKGY